MEMFASAAKVGHILRCIYTYILDIRAVLCAQSNCVIWFEFSM